MIKTQKTTTPWPDGQGLKKVKEVAEYLHVHVNTIYNWLAAGRLECVRMPSNKIAFTFDQVQEFINCHRERIDPRWQVVEDY